MVTPVTMNTEPVPLLLDNSDNSTNPHAPVLLNSSGQEVESVPFLNPTGDALRESPRSSQVQTRYESTEAHLVKITSPRLSPMHNIDRTKSFKSEFHFSN